MTYFHFTPHTGTNRKMYRALLFHEPNRHGALADIATYRLLLMTFYCLNIQDIAAAPRDDDMAAAACLPDFNASIYIMRGCQIC